MSDTLKTLYEDKEYKAKHDELCRKNNELFGDIMTKNRKKSWQKTKENNSGKLRKYLTNPKKLEVVYTLMVEQYIYRH